MYSGVDVSGAAISLLFSLSPNEVRTCMCDRSVRATRLQEVNGRGSTGVGVDILINHTLDTRCISFRCKWAEAGVGAGLLEVFLNYFVLHSVITVIVYK